MTENAYKASPAHDAADRDAIVERATWNLNSLLESGEDDLAADLVASYRDELADLLPRAS